MKRRALPLLVLGGALAALAAERPAVRNPFWPIDYAGVSTPISAEIRTIPKPPRPVPKAEPVQSARKAADDAARKAAEAAARAAEAVQPPRRVTRTDWLGARRALKLTSPAVFIAEDGTRRTTININGNIYADGDIVSLTHDNIRFTWRIRGLDATAESLKLVRVKARCLEDTAKGVCK